MRKKIRFIVLLIVPIVVLTILIVSIYTEKNDVSYVKVKPDDKILYSDNLMASYLGPPSLEMGYHLTDVVIYGEIINIYQGDIDFLLPVGDKLGEELPKMTCTYYEVKVEKTYLGQVDSEIITCRVLGDFDSLCTKPREKGKVILMLNEQIDDSTNEKVYGTTMSEHSIITIDEKGRMYSYSDTEELSALDGKEVKEFEKAFKKIMKANDYKQKSKKELSDEIDKKAKEKRQKLGME